MNDVVISWVGWTAAILFLLAPARSWWHTWKLFDGIDGAMVWQMFHLCRFTGHMRVFGLSLLAMLSLICVRALGVPIPSGMMAAMMVVALVPLLKLLVPPAILFLGGSSDRGTQLFFQLQLLLSPLRTVALLDPRGMGPLGLLLRLDLLRTSTEETWKSMVHRLIDIAPVFVIDTVHRTRPVRYEAFLMLAPERAGRTVFVCDDEGGCPSLVAEGIDPAKYAIPVTHPSQIERAADRLLSYWRMLPKDEKANRGSSTPVVPDGWDSLPSVLMIALVDGLDGDSLLAQARTTNKTLISLLVPLSSQDRGAAEMSVELSVDFSRNPRLVGLYLEASGLAMVRRDFLLQNAELLDVHVSGLRPGSMTFEDLNKPEPVGVAVHELCRKWRAAAAGRGLEFRFAKK